MDSKREGRSTALLKKLLKTFIKALGMEKIAKNINFFIKARLMKKSVRILLSRYGKQGDILLTAPAIRALKKVFPNSYIIFDTYAEYTLFLAILSLLM